MRRRLTCGLARCPDRSPAAARPARPLAVRAASFARRVVSKPGQAPQASRRPPIGRGVCVLPGQAPPPPTGTAAGPSGILHTCRAWLLACGSARCLNVWPDPSKPASPLLVGAEPQLKPSSPLRARNGCFSCAFRSQRCCGFQRLLLRGEHWCWRFHAGLHQWLQRCHWFQSWHVAVSCARKSSPRMPRCVREREKVRPACPKRLKNAVFRRVGRTLSRKCRWRGRVGRTFSRVSRWRGRVGRTFSRVSRWKPRAGRTLSRMLALRLM